MIWNMTGGGGGVATIFVSYPYSSTLTCTNGSVTLTATNSTTSRANAHFNVPVAGSWTLTARNGSFSATETVSVSVGGSYFVELYYKSYLVEEGIIKVTPVLSDPNNIKNNLDANGNDIYESYFAPRHTWFFCTRGNYGNHHCEVMFPVTITYATRLAFERLPWVTPPGQGGFVPENPRDYVAFHGARGGFMRTATTDTSPGTNYQISKIYEGGIQSDWLMQINGEITYTDLTRFSGSGYASLGWESMSGGLLGVEVKNFYVEY